MSSTSIVNLNDGTITEKTVANETPLKPQNDEAGKVVSTPLQNSNQARSAAKGKVKSSGMKSIEAEAVTIGLPYLKARDSITVENIGKKFSGNWRITKIRHEISSSGYLCHLSLAKNDFSANIGGQSNKTGEPPKKLANSNNNGNPTPAGEGKKKDTQTWNMDTGKQVK